MERDGSASSVRFGAFTLIPGEQRLLRDGQPVLLTPKAFDLLAVLATNAGRLLTKEQLMQAVWPDTIVEESNLTYNVFALRKALDDSAENSKYIETVPKRGYRFVATVTTGVSGLSRSLPGAEVEPSVQHPAPGGEPATVAAVFTVAELLPSTGSYHHILKGRRAVAAIALAVGALAGAGIVLVTPRAPVPPLTTIRAQISPGVQLAEASPFALSPDGGKLAFAGQGPDGVTRLWVLQMGDEKARPLSGTEALLGGLVPPIFWSPDSQLVAFDAVGQLRSVDVRDGATRKICALSNLAVGGSWNADGVIVIGQPNAGLIRCSVADGRVSELTRLDPDKGETAHVIPFFLPDQRHFLYVRVARNRPEDSGLYLGSLDDTPDAGAPKRLLATGFGAAYVPANGTSTGQIIFLRDATLFAQAFDERALQLRGDPTALATPVGSYLDGGFLSASQNGMIAFRPPDKDFQLTWFDKRGNKTGTLGEVGRYTSVAISPDDTRVATAKEVTGSMIDQDVWILETARPTTTRVTFGPVLEDVPVWSPDSRRLMFTIGGDTGNLFEQTVDGMTKPRALLEKTAQHNVPSSVSRDGRFLLYTVANNDDSRLDVWVLPLTGKAKPFPFIQRNLDQSDAQFSQDGLWVAYTSNESGRDQVHLQRFGEPSDGQPVEPETIVVSAGGGTAPRWRADGKELYYFGADGSLMAADVTIGATLSIGTPRALFQIPGSRGDWDVVSDGTRFLIAIPSGADASAPFTILWNRPAQPDSVR